MLFTLLIIILTITTQIVIIRFIFKKISFQKIIINSTILIGVISFLYLIRIEELDVALYFLFNFYFLMYSVFNIVNMSQTSSRINLMMLIKEKKVKKIQDIKKFYNSKNFFNNRINRLLKLNWIENNGKNSYAIKTITPFFFITLFNILRKILFLNNK